MKLSLTSPVAKALAGKDASEQSIPASLDRNSFASIINHVEKN